ncbi:MAG: hypothetical protein KBB50_04085, partial [Candidatus Pacebacteria bacterium]|nr:hypothetical protein [Candidatus Paceibacterota bacterium]
MTTVIKRKYCNRKYKDYNIDDFKYEFGAHKEWHGLSTGGIAKVEGGYSFYEAFLDRVQQSSKGDDTKYVEMMRQIFPHYTKLAEKIDRNHYLLSDFKKEFDVHPEWHGLSTDGIGKVEGGRSFYKAFRTFVEQLSNGDCTKHVEMMRQIFPDYTKHAEKIDRNHYVLSDFKKEFDVHPEWHGLSTVGIYKVEGGTSFYKAFLGRVKQSSKGDDTKHVEMMRQIFPDYTKLAEKIDRNHYTLSDFKKEFDVHPEWHGLSTARIREVEGGLSFYEAFLDRVQQSSNGDDTKYVEMMRQIFPDYTKKAEKIDRNHYTLSDFKYEFDTHPEWHGLSTSGIAKVEGGQPFYVAFRTFAKRESCGNKKKQFEIMEQIFPRKLSMIYADRGYLLQYILEIVLRLVGNTRLFVEPAVM